MKDDGRFGQSGDRGWKVVLTEVLDHLSSNSMLIASDGDRAFTERTDVGIQSQQEVGKMGCVAWSCQGGNATNRFKLLGHRQGNSATKTVTDQKFRRLKVGFKNCAAQVRSIWLVVKLVVEKSPSLIPVLQNRTARRPAMFG